MNSAEATTLSAVEELSSIVADAHGPDWFVKLRNSAMDQFNDSDWPRTSEEEWRRTNLSPFEFEIYSSISADSFVETSAVDSVASDVPRSGLLRYLNGSLLSAEIDRQTADQGVV